MLSCHLHERVYWSDDGCPMCGLAAQRDALEAEVEALRAERDALAARVEQLLRAGDTLSICAQTTGGTAGPDDGLIEAIKGWERARAALSTVREKTDERA
jgi:hypothetical protein